MPMARFLDEVSGCCITSSSQKKAKRIVQIVSCPRSATTGNGNRAAKAEDDLTHKRLLHLAQDLANRPAFEVRLVQVPPVCDGNSGVSPSSSPRKEVPQSALNGMEDPQQQSILPKNGADPDNVQVH
ncbi:unnamed protein product [Ilex paraguariensis]|uniref:Uncharacterized protein n=1 Tax=Ilex paraguariensis TaxID=185542 RepID=A0ABC8T6S5_9AQUA